MRRGRDGARGRPARPQSAARQGQVRRLGCLRRGTVGAVGCGERHAESRDGRVEAIRTLRVARASAITARTQAINQLKGLLTSGPAELREQLRDLTTTGQIAACARLRPARDLADPEQAAKAALRRLARRHQHLCEKITDADSDLKALVTAAAPQLLELAGVGVEVAGQLLVTAGDNPERLHSEAGFAHLCGVAPIPASSGRTNRHRLNRAGDREANRALYIIVLGRLRYDARTRAYAQRRTTEGLSKRDIIRCLKRYVAREIYPLLFTLPLQKQPQQRLEKTG